MAEGPRYTASGAALHALLAEAARLPRGAPGLEAGRRGLLLALAAGPPATAAGLARRAAVPASTRQAVQHLADSLLAEGLLERRPNPRHRRAPLLALTASGRRRAAAVAAGQAERLNAVAARLEPGELRAAARLLRGIRDTFASGPSRPPG